MADDLGSNDGGGAPNSYLWVLFLSLLILLLVVSMYALCHGARSFWDEYILCRRVRGCCCCCTMDMEAYRRERESLRRLRELRHVHRMEQLQLRHRLAVAHALNEQQRRRGGSGSVPTVNNSVLELHPIPLATFSQIPGIPHSYSTSGRVLTPSELQTRAMAPEARAAYANMSSLGFILVPPAPMHLDATRRRGSSGTSHDIRDSLTPEQRREILDRLLVFTNYHEDDAAIHDENQEETAPQDVMDKNKSPEDSTLESLANEDVESGSIPENTATNEQEPATFAFPLHEEPEEIDKTCAICLDEFEEGELINDISKCPHAFHRDCLLSWLDRHSVCPCCRRPMVTENDWQSAATATNNETETTETNDTTQHDNST